MLKAVTFDLGDTLIDYGPMSYLTILREGLVRAWDYLHETDARPDELSGGFRTFSKHLSRRVRRTFYRSKLLIEDRDASLAINEELDRLGLRLTDLERREFVRRLLFALEHHNVPMPGVVEVLDALRGRGLRLAVVSNTVIPPWFLDESLADLGLLHYFEHRYYSCAVGAKKPERGIFRQALADLGVAPADTLHVGDRYLTDVWGARRAGLRTCLKVGHRSMRFPPLRADFVIHDMPELLPIVTRLTTPPA